MLLRKQISGILVLATLVSGSCAGPDPVDAPEPVRVLLVYAGTDNNLSGLEQAKLQAIRDGWTGRANDRIIVYIDKGRGADARLIEISNLAPDEQPREIAGYGTENSASHATLSRVIADVVDRFPGAGSYGLLVFSHASGWLPEGVYNLSRSVITDGASEMELADFAAAIPDGVFDYIVFETCFMAGIEVAWELRGKAPLILASSAEIVDPGFAPVYAAATRKLLAANLPAFGEAAFNHTLTYAETNPRRSATYSVIRTAPLDALAAFVRSNCDFTRTVDIPDIQHFDRLNDYRLFFDFEEYHARLLPTDALRAELSRLVGECVIWKAATREFMTQSAGYNGFFITNHSGLTTYIPQAQFPGLNDSYKKVGWAKFIQGK